MFRAFVRRHAWEQSIGAMVGLNGMSRATRDVCRVCISWASRLGNPMERKAASQYSEQTVWRPTIIHPLDSHKSNVPNISGNDITASMQAVSECQCLSPRAVVERFR